MCGCNSIGGFNSFNNLGGGMSNFRLRHRLNGFGSGFNDFDFGSGFGLGFNSGFSSNFGSGSGYSQYTSYSNSYGNPGYSYSSGFNGPLWF